MMTDEELRTAFENLTLDPRTFSHEQHVRLAWTCLRGHSLTDVLRTFPESLRRFATAAGAPDKYQEAMTVSYLTIIAARMDESGERDSWPRFIAANPDLLTRLA